MNLSPLLRQRFFDVNGLPLAGGQLYSYAAGTTTPQVTYSNETGTTNTNPVVLDAYGYADVWLDPTLSYKFILEDVNNNFQWSVDQVSFPLGITSWSTNTVYGQGSIVADSSGYGLLYVSLISSNQGNALTNTSAWRIFAGNTRTVSTSTSLAITDDFVRSNSTSGNVTLTLPACATTPIGKRITVKDVGTGGNTTSLQGSGTDNIDGNNIYSSTLNQYASATVQNNGASWDVVLVPASKSIAQSMLAARATGATIGAGGVAISASSSGSYTCTSTTAQAVTNMTVTLTTTGRPVRLALRGGSVYFSGSGSGTVQFLNGSTTLVSQQISDASGGVGYPSSSFEFLDMTVNGTPGTYTYTVDALVSSGSSLGIQNAYLIAYEI